MYVLIMFSEEYIDPWFFIDHRQTNIVKSVTNGSGLNEEIKVNIRNISGKGKEITDMLRLHNDKFKKRKVRIYIIYL